MTDYVKPVGDALVDRVDAADKYVDKDREKDSDPEEELSEEEGSKSNEFTFQSAIDVGSHFIDIDPHSELIFREQNGNLISQFTIKNPCKNSPIAFFVYTSAQSMDIKVSPYCGFIPATFMQIVKIYWEASKKPNKEILENSMFFIKALPLSPDMNVSKVQGFL